MRRVCRCRSDDTGVHRQKAINGGNSITETIEENDIFDVDLCAAELVVLFHQEFARFEHTLGRAIAVAAVCADEVNDNVLDPVGNLTFLFNRVTDVFPMDWQAECLELVRLLHDLADFVRKFLSTFAQQSSTHFRLL